MDFTDRRSGRIVFMSQCLLNQNLRFPGIAVERGACGALVRLMTESGVGIEPIPCLERLGWGGVARKSYFRYQPLLLKRRSRPFEALARLGTKLWIMRYARLCGREARKIAGHIRDYVSSGYVVVGIVAVDDSPTDGVTKTIDMLSSARRLRSLGVDPEVLSHPSFAAMKDLIPSLCTRGTGIFISRLKSRLERMRIPVPIAGYDPWRDPETESARIAELLPLQGEKA